MHHLVPVHEDRTRATGVLGNHRHTLHLVVVGNLDLAAEVRPILPGVAGAGLGYIVQEEDLVAHSTLLDYIDLAEAPEEHPSLVAVDVGADSRAGPAGVLEERSIAVEGAGSPDSEADIRRRTGFDREGGLGVGRRTYSVRRVYEVE